MSDDEDHVHATLDEVLPILSGDVTFDEKKLIDVVNEANGLISTLAADVDRKHSTQLAMGDLVHQVAALNHLYSKAEDRAKDFERQLYNERAKQETSNNKPIWNAAASLYADVLNLCSGVDHGYGGGWLEAKYPKIHKRYTTMKDDKNPDLLPPGRPAPVLSPEEVKADIISQMKNMNKSRGELEFDDDTGDFKDKELASAIELKLRELRLRLAQHKKNHPSLSSDVEGGRRDVDVKDVKDVKDSSSESVDGTRHDVGKRLRSTTDGEKKKKKKKDKKDKKEKNDEPSEYHGSKIFHGEATDNKNEENDEENDEDDVPNVPKDDVPKEVVPPQTKKQKTVDKSKELKYHFTSDAAFDKYVDAYKKGLERMSAGQNTVYQKFKLDWPDCDFKKDVLKSMKNDEGAWTYDKDSVVVGIRRGEMPT